MADPELTQDEIDAMFGDDDECPNCDGGGWVESCFVDCCDCLDPPCVWRRCDWCNHDGRVSKHRPAPGGGNG